MQVNTKKTLSSIYTNHLNCKFQPKVMSRKDFNFFQKQKLAVNKEIKNYLSKVLSFLP